MDEQDKRLGLWQIVGSVLASFFGVQKDATRERDFREGRARDFILVGLGLTLVFVLVLWGVVRLVIALATGDTQN